MKCVLVVAGSDSGGGAGIQADLKALASVGVHGCTAITCVTAQNTRGVEATYPLPVEALRDQIRAVREDIPLAAVKTGMLYSEEIVQAVVEELEGLEVPRVVDPVMVATAGSPLHASGFVAAVRAHLLPGTTLVTPNLDEAEALTGRRIRDVAGMEEAAEALLQQGPQAALVKGGHLKGELVDVLLVDGEVHTFPGVRLPEALHGSGCTYASVIAGHLAQGRGLVESVTLARRKVAQGFETAYAVGGGFRLINAAYVADRWTVWDAVRGGAEELAALLPPRLVPEVGVNLGYALPGATGPEDVCAVDGRVVRRGDELVAVGPPAFGASRHVARIILAARAFDPAVRSAMNLRYTEEVVASCKAAGLVVGTFDRAEEPEGRSTMEWGTRTAIQSLGRVPDVIYDLGGPHKVAMVRLLGRTPREVLDVLRRVVAP